MASLVISKLFAGNIEFANKMEAKLMTNEEYVERLFSKRVIERYENEKEKLNQDIDRLSVDNKRLSGDNKRLSDALKKAGINPEAVLAGRD